MTPIIAKMDETLPLTHMPFQATARQRFYCSPSISRACLDFVNHRLGSSESAANFLAVLHELAPECCFPATYLNHVIAQQILVGCHSTKAQERMLLC